MKIKVKKLSYDEVCALPADSKFVPKKLNLFFRTLTKTVSASELKQVHFKCEKEGMDQLHKDEPCLILMNHSSSIDLKIAATVLYPKPFQIVCTSDGFIGKRGLMQNIGCIPTRKFVTDTNLVRTMNHCLKKLKSSVLMYPEASYTFDGTATPLPESLGKCIKLLGVPVIMLRTYGAFLRDPLYNGLRLRKTDVTAKMSYILSPEDIKEKTPAEINKILKEHFTFDNFRLQQESGTKITEDFRAEGLNRMLYKCPHCLKEGTMLGKGINLSCTGCGVSYTLTETGFLEGDNCTAKFTHVPDWYNWEREFVKQELLSNNYRLDVDVTIRIMKDMNYIYEVGDGHLTHDSEGFTLTGCDGKLNYSQSPLASYGLYSDYFWYELGDMICIGNEEMLYYCFPKEAGDIVAKTRLAAEELYKIKKKEVKKSTRE